MAATYSDTYTDDGSVTGVPGTIYQYGPTGQIQIIYRPPAQSVSTDPDPDGDGYDNKTGLPVGVTSFGGRLYYQGKEVNPDGSLKTPEQETGNDAKTWTGYGPKGQGTYYLDGPGGTPGTYIGATQAPSSGSSGGSTFTGSGMKFSVPSGSGGGGSSGSSRDYVGEIQARTDSELTIARERAALEREFFFAKLAAENDPNNLQNQIRLQQLGLQMQQFAASEGRQQADLRLRTIDSFRDAFTDTDPAQQHAMLYAQGVGAGGNIVNRLAAGDNALSDQALSGAAALLRELRIPPTNPLANWTMPGLGGSPTGGPGAPTGGVPSTGVPGTPAVPGLPPVDPAIAQQQAEANQLLSIQRQQRQSTNYALDAERAKFLTENAEGNWAQSSMQGNVPYYTNKVTGMSLPVGDWYSLMEDVRMAQGTATRGDELLNSLNPAEAVWAGAVPGAQGSGGNWTTHGGTFRQGPNPIHLKDYGQQIYDMPWGPSLTNTIPNAPTVNHLTGGYNAPTGNLSGDDRQIGVDPTLLPSTDPIPRATVPMLAMGGLAGTAAITGDPQPGSNQPNPELTEWTPQGLRVTPLNQMPRQQANALMRGLPRHYGGYDPRRESDYTGGQAAALGYTQPTPVEPTYTQPAPVQTTTQPAATQTSATAGSDAAQSPYPAQAPTGYGTPAPTVMSGLNTPSGYINTTGLTPEEQALLDEVRQLRESTPVPDLGGMSPFDLQFGSLTPSSREAYFKGIQAQKGIRAEDFAWEVGRANAMMPGLGRGQMSTGY